MATIVSMHSFRGGTGKSNLTASLATLLAAEGRRVGVIDTDIQSPGIHVLFGLDETRMTRSLNDYLWGKCGIEETAHDVTPQPEAAAGCVLLIPSSIKAGEIARVLREEYDQGLLNDGIHKLIEALRLDVLMIDTHPGLNEETLLSIAVSRTLVVVEMRADQRDGQRSAFSVVARGHAAAANVRLEYPNREQAQQASSGELPAFSELRSATLQARTLLMVTALLAVAVLATATVLTLANRETMLKDAEIQGQLLARLLALSARFEEPKGGPSSAGAR